MLLSMDTTAPPVNTPNAVSSNKIGNLTMDEIRQEIDEYYEQIRKFTSRDPREVIQMISSFTARASQIRVNLVRKDNKLLQNFRTKEIDPFLTECDRQFKYFSRIGQLNKDEYEQTRGQF